MKILKYIAGTFALGLLATACVDKDPDEQFFPNPDVAFTYEIEGDQYTYDYYVVSTIKFNNTSSASGNFVWDFGDGTTSTEVSPTHKYEKAGLYKVTLTHESKGSTTSPLLIYDIVPVLSVASTSTEIVEYNNTYVTFNLELPNPENLPVRYEWTFPEGTTYEDGTEVTSFTGYSDENGNISYPEKVKFRNIGSQRIDIRTYFDTTGENRRLEDSYLNVQVGTSEPAPTLYYAQRGGNIKAVKLLENIPEGSKVLPYDLGVPAGSTVFNLCYADITTEQVDEEGKPVVEGWIYILDAGKQYYYINDEDGVLGDGKITALRTDGTNVNTVITNVGGAAFLDPFVGTVYNGKLYYTDRNTGCSSIELTKRGEQQGKKSSTERDSYAWQNNLLPFYGRGISYGSISNSLVRDKAGYWWWGKKYNGEGILRFKDSDIYQTQKEAEAAGLPAPMVLSGMRFTAFTIDEDRQGLYLWRRTPNPGFVHFKLPAINADVDQTKDLVAYIAMDADPVNTTEAEGLHTTQFAVDKTNGRVYFCFRPDATDTSGVPAGLVYYDPADNKMHRYSESTDLGTGIVINPNPTKLF